MKLIREKSAQAKLLSLLAVLLLSSPGLAVAATFPLYLSPGSSNVSIAGAAGSTNFTSGTTGYNNLTNVLSAAAPTVPGTPYYKTILSQTAPANGSSVMVGKNSSFFNNGKYYSLGRAYFNFDSNSPTLGFYANTYLTAPVTGSFYVSSSSTSDKFVFMLVDYDTSAGSVSAINTSAEISSAGSSPALSTITFGSWSQASPYTLLAGHYLAVEVFYKAASTNTGSFYCNSSYKSKLDVQIQTKITSSLGDGNGSYTSGPATTPGTAWVDVFPGSLASYTVAGQTNYNIQNLSVDGSSVSAATGTHSYTYQFSTTNPNSNNYCRNHSIVASFVSSAGNLTITPGTGGTISCTACGPLTWSPPGS